MCVHLIEAIEAHFLIRYISDCGKLFGAGRIVDYDLASDAAPAAAADVKVAHTSNATPPATHAHERAVPLTFVLDY